MYRRLYNEAKDLAESIRQGTNPGVQEVSPGTSLKGLGARSARESTSGFIQAGQEAESVSRKFRLAKEMEALEQQNQELREYLNSTGEAESVSDLKGIRPLARGEKRRVVPDTPLKENKLFMSKLKSMEKKYPGFTTDEALYVFHKEASSSTTAQHKRSKAAGLFQAIPAVAKSLGTSVGQILKMSAVEQLDLYDKYLETRGYDGTQSLGLLQAAPAYARKDPATIVYRKGSKAWEQNPGWRGPDGEITVGSINRFYKGNK